MNTPVFRTLAIDYGLARTGLAITSPAVSIALPLKTLHARGHELWKALDLIIKQYTPHEVVIGLPKLLNGQDSDQTTKTRTFIEEFSKRFPSIRVVVFDERLTSKQAERLLMDRGLSRKKRANLNDETSAWILLSCYLESMAHPGNAATNP